MLTAEESIKIAHEVSHVPVKKAACIEALKIVQQHRGEIKVETEEGKFTEFIISLPRDGKREA